MEEKQKKNKGITFFVIILIGITLFFSKKENQEKFIKSMEPTTKATNEELEVLESISLKQNIDDVGFYEKGIMIWKDNKLTRLKMDGSKEWEKKFNFEDPNVCFGEKKIYVYEKPTGDIYYLNQLGETINRVKFDTNINNLVESFGNILIHVKKDGIESINILNKKGTIIEKKPIKDDNILTYSINKNNSIYSISTLDLKGQSIKSEIQVFQKGGELLYSSEFKDQIILYSKFIQDNKLIVMTDKSLYLINNGNILWQKQFQLIKDIYIDKENINILFSNTLETISMDGKLKWKSSFAEEYKKIIPYDKYLVVYGDQYIIGLKDGEEVFKYKSEDIILKIIPGNRNLIVIYEDKIKIMSL